MMVAGSFKHDFPRSSSASARTTRKSSMGMDNTRPRSTPPTLSRTDVAKPTVSTEEETFRPTSCNPVQIPQTMIRPPRPHLTAQTMRSAGRNGSRPAKRSLGAHDPNALPPAVAALLAVTAIPPQRRNTSRKKPSPETQRRISIDELVQEWRRETDLPSSLTNRSPLDILLEQASDDEKTEFAEDCIFADVETEREPDLISDTTSRSVSSVSLTSMPSLDAAYSTVSTYTPRTPSINSRRTVLERKEKLTLSPPTEVCLDNHPLRPGTPVEAEPEFFDAKRDPVKVPRQTKQQKSTLKSNLTASLQALKFAAKSLSNFTASSIPSDDMLTNSILGPRFASEMRPQFQGVPDPALRRYFNPTPFSASSPDFSAQLQDALGQAQPLSKEGEQAPMIQMQTYRRVSRRTRVQPAGTASDSSNGTSQNANQTALLVPITVRQREPRENGDFLRVIVLEMNMRRTGKLDPKAAGRARVWLPPRKNDSLTCPRRWIAVSAHDV